MRKLLQLVWRIRLWKDTNGQDMVEYALLAGFIAIAAGAVLPDVSASMSTIYSKVQSQLTAAGSV